MRNVVKTFLIYTCYLYISLLWMFLIFKMWNLQWNIFYLIFRNFLNKLNCEWAIKYKIVTFRHGIRPKPSSLLPNFLRTWFLGSFLLLCSFLISWEITLSSKFVHQMQLTLSLLNPSKFISLLCTTCT